MKKNILILLIVVFLIIIGVIIFLISKKISLQPITKNVNISQPVGIENKEKIIGNFSLFLDELINKEKIPPELVGAALDYYSFCQYKNSNITFDEQCAKTNEKYYGIEDSVADCALRNGNFAAIDFIKKGEKDNFLRICQEYIFDFKAAGSRDTKYAPGLNTQRFEQFYNNCNLLWDNKMYGDKEFCDAGDNCNPILLAEDQNCSNKINIDSVNLDSLKTIQCQTEVALRRASQKSDCSGIKNLTAHLFCLDAFDDKVCPDLKDSLENLKLPDFVAKYQLQAAQ